MGFLSKPPPSSRGKTNLPSLNVRGRGVVQSFLSHQKGKEEKIPNASLVYGISSAALLSFSLYHLFTGLWFTAFLLFVVALIVFGFSLYFLRYSG
jgi:hypothetical protein